MASQRAFTLVELSIVLVVMGLLVGGVLSGQALIRAAELRAVTKERDQYLTAITAFQDKYYALPGDMPNAVKFWGAAAGGDANGIDSSCTAVSSATGTATCNGNGDGYISLYRTLGERTEFFRFWQQLVNAGFLEGSYSGVGEPNGSYVGGPDGVIALGSNIPASKFPNAGWTIIGFDIEDANLASGVGNVLFFGAPHQGGMAPIGWEGKITWFPALTPQQAYNIDKKTDDGAPHTGQTQTIIGDDFPCTDVTHTLYNVSNESVQCNLSFESGF